jgi:hypothetical protein
MLIMDSKYPLFGLVSSTSPKDDIFYVRVQNYTWAFPKKKFQQFFPDSMLTSALELSSDSIITLDNPEVTPEIMAYLWFILKFGFVLPPRHLQTRTAGAYLGIPILLIAANSCLRNLAQRGNLLDAKAMSDPEKYWPLISTAARVNDLDVVRYLFSLIPAEITQSMDAMLMLDAAIAGWAEVFRLLLQRGLNPRTIVETGEYRPPFIESLVDAERCIPEYEDRIQFNPRASVEFLNSLKDASTDQIPHILLLAPVEMQLGHKAILEIVLELGLPDDLIHNLIREYITCANVQFDVVKQLVSHLKVVNSEALSQLYPVIAARYLSDIYFYFRDELKIPGGITYAVKFGDVTHLTAETEAECLTQIKTALNSGRYDIAALLLPKVSERAQIKLLTCDDVSTPEILAFLLEFVPATTEYLKEWIDDALAGYSGVNMVMVVARRHPDVYAHLRAAMIDPEIQMNLSFRHHLAGAMDLTLPAGIPPMSKMPEFLG